MKRRGIVLVVTTIILSIVVIVAAALVTLLSRDLYTTRRLRASAQAYFLAEAGIEEGIRDLYDNSFNFSNFPINKNLGDGSFTATLDTSQYASAQIVKITAIGTVGPVGNAVTRTIRVIAQDTRISALTYSTLSGGKMRVRGFSEIWGNIHSNNSSNSNWSPALQVGGIIFPGTVHGDATACGKAKTTWQGTVTGSLASNQPSQEMPPFDDGFWNYYKQLAIDSGDYYSGTTTFTSHQSPANGVIWVQGQARLNGNWTLTGCLISTGPMRINWGLANSGTITHVAKSGCEDFPALMSKNSYIQIWDPVTINGLVYASSYIEILPFSIPLSTSVITGSVICSGRLNFDWLTHVHYSAPNPPGLTAPAPLTVICWSD